MLYIDNPIGTVEGVMIYRDHANRNLFYYMAEKPRLAKSGGRPEISLIKYRRDITDNPAFDPETAKALGGGLLTFTVELTVPEPVLTRVKAHLRRFATGEVQLSPIQFREGTVRLSIAKEASSEDGATSGPTSGFAFVEEILGSTKPSLFGANRATFSLVLSQEGVTLMEQALKGGISPFGVIYDLKTPVMRPAFHVRIVAEYRRIYERMESQFAMRARSRRLAIATEISDAFEKLRELGSIKVEVTHFTNDENLKTQAKEAFEWFKTEMLKDFFKSSLPPPAGPANATSLLDRLQTLLGNFNSGQTGVQLQPQQQAPAPPGNPAPAPTNLRSGVRTTTQNNQAVAPQQNQGDELQIQAAFVLKTLRQDELKRREFDYSMQAATDWEFGATGQFNTMGKGIDLDQVIQVIDLDDEFFKRLLVDVSVADAFEAAGISQVNVEIEYPGADPWGKAFKPDALGPEKYARFLNDKKQLDYKYKTEVHFKADSPWKGKANKLESTWNDTKARILTVDPLADIGLLDVSVGWGPIVPGIEQVQAKLSYEDAANGFTINDTVVLKPGEPDKSWKLRLSDREQTSFGYQLVYFFEGGARFEADPVQTDNPTVLVDPPFRDRYKIRIIPMIDISQIAEAILEIVYEETDTGYKREEQVVINADNPRPSPVEILTLAEEPPKYSYELTVVKTNGSVYESGKVESDAPVILVGEGQGVTNRFKVKLANNQLASKGLVALRVTMVGPGDMPDREDVLFVPSDTNDRTVTLIQPPDVDTFTYSYEVTGYKADGTVVEGAKDSATGTGTLIIALPG